MQADSTEKLRHIAAAEHAQHAQSLMQQVRKLGRLPRESESHPQEQLLAHRLRNAKASGLLVAYEEELQDFADKLRALQKRKQPHALLQSMRNTQQASCSRCASWVTCHVNHRATRRSSCWHNSCAKPKQTASL